LLQGGEGKGATGVARLIKKRPHGWSYGIVE